VTWTSTVARISGDRHCAGWLLQDIATAGSGSLSPVADRAREHGAWILA